MWEASLGLGISLPIQALPRLEGRASLSVARQASLPVKGLGMAAVAESAVSSLAPFGKLGSVCRADPRVWCLMSRRQLTLTLVVSSFSTGSRRNSVAQVGAPQCGPAFAR